MCVCLSVSLSVCRAPPPHPRLSCLICPVCLSVSLSVCLSVCLSLYLSVCLPVYLPTYLTTYLSVYISIHLSIYLFISIYACNMLLTSRAFTTILRLNVDISQSSKITGSFIFEVHTEAERNHPCKLRAQNHMWWHNICLEHDNFNQYSSGPFWGHRHFVLIFSHVIVSGLSVRIPRTPSNCYTAVAVKEKPCADI